MSVISGGHIHSRMGTASKPHTKAGGAPILNHCAQVTGWPVAFSSRLAVMGLAA